MVQAYSQGYVGSLEEIRAVVRRSTELSRYEPEGDEDDWDKLRERFSGVMDASPEIDSLERG
jgi:hypothetical protein